MVHTRSIVLLYLNLNSSASIVFKIAHSFILTFHIYDLHASFKLSKSSNCFVCLTSASSNFNLSFLTLTHKFNILTLNKSSPGGGTNFLAWKKLTNLSSIYVIN